MVVPSAQPRYMKTKTDQAIAVQFDALAWFAFPGSLSRFASFFGSKTLVVVPLSFMLTGLPVEIQQPQGANSLARMEFRWGSVSSYVYMYIRSNK